MKKLILLLLNVSVILSCSNENIEEERTYMTVAGNIYVATDIFDPGLTVIYKMSDSTMSITYSDSYHGIKKIEYGTFRYNHPNLDFTIKQANCANCIYTINAIVSSDRRSFRYKVFDYGNYYMIFNIKED